MMNYTRSFWSIRLPMTLTAVVVGASLGLAGLLMQTVLANPLASPYTLGISAAAGFGAALSIITGFSVGSLVIRHPIIGFTDGITGLPAHLLSGPTAGDDTANSGVERHCGAVLLPVVAITHVISASPEAMQQIVFWLFGSLLKANMQGC